MRPDRPVMIDAYCKAGGATKGYQEAGFFVIGIDKDPQPNYVGDRFVQADALDFLETLISNGGGIAIDEDGWAVDYYPVAVAASPPCQRFSSVTATSGRPEDHPELIGPTRELLSELGLPFASAAVALAFHDQRKRAEEEGH